MGPPDPIVLMVALLRTALAEGRAVDGETQEIAGFRQAEAVMRMWERTESAAPEP